MSTTQVTHKIPAARKVIANAIAAIGLATLLPVAASADVTSDAAHMNINADQNAVMGEVIVFRDKGLSANADMYYRLYVNGERMGKLKRNTAFHMQLPVGEHVIETNDPDETTITVTVNEGRTTFVQASIDKRWDIDMRTTQPSVAMSESLQSCDNSFTHRCETSAAGCCADEQSPNVDQDRLVLR